MRREIVVLGSFIIVLILIAGCTSTQDGTSTGSKSQNPTQVYTTGKITFESYMDPIFECNLPPKDPILFQKFLPNVPGYDRFFGQNLSGRNNNFQLITIHTKKTTIYNYANRITETYHISDRSNPNTKSVSVASVSFEDLGPCAPSVDTRLNLVQSGTFENDNDRTTVSKITNFHGYPAKHTIVASKNPGYIRQDWVDILISNRLHAIILVQGYWELPPLSEAEAEAEIEKFANAIDFRGLASLI